MAILLGAPIAVGLGYLYYRNQSTKLSEESDDSGADKKKLKDKSISIDGDDKVSGTAATPAATATTVAPKKIESKLEQAIKFKNDGNAKFKSGKFNEAIEMYDKAIETCPKSNPIDLSTFYQNRAAAYEQLKKWSAVKADCTKALELNTRYVKALNRRAKANENTNELIASLEDITATCILEGFQNNSTLVFADRVLKELGKFIFIFICKHDNVFEAKFIYHSLVLSGQVVEMPKKHLKAETLFTRRSILSTHISHHSQTIRCLRAICLKQANR